MFLVKCFGIGLLSTLGVGPIFILTFNRASMYGFWKGAITAFGAALADGLLFALGLFGVLSFFSEWKHSFLIMDFAGGLFLVAMGLYYFFKKVKSKDLRPSIVGISSNIFIIPIKAFFMTAINPMALVYFTFWSTQIFPNKYIPLSFHQVMAGSWAVFGGTLGGLLVVAAISSVLGANISGRNLVKVTHVTGVLFVIFGGYFLYDFAQAAIKILIS